MAQPNEQSEFATFQTTFLLVIGIIFAVIAGATASRYLGVPIFSTNSVTLPNGAVLRQHYWPYMDRHETLYAPNGQTILMHSVDLVCFNDRYVEATPAGHVTEESLIYDTLEQWSYTWESFETVGQWTDFMWSTGLASQQGCGGYFQSMLGPQLLYRDFHSHLRVRCADANPSGPLRTGRDWVHDVCAP